ncbi:anti-sigma factor family protein [Paenibacillus pini]|uniref:Anti-sigma-W factor RsiW n=1 Tax=Paenibacillus pini JCM 16418 TaxID=1236976 RepID=W7YZS8_9BACL|nr:zf-HC2 domain-containing protein [Paenibacillus pini]GAF10181.1 hypothetical protein JCM16418_4358 [Paenibacillus pini JCM 16418]
MNCDIIQYQMAAYVAHELSPETSLIMDRHIQSCPSCQEWLHEVMAMSRMWQDSSSLSEDAPDLVTSVMQEIRQMPVSKIRSRDKSTNASPQRSMFVHYTIAACLTFLLFQFGVFEHLGSGLTEVTHHLSNSVQHILIKGE